ncbi:MFS transporter [Thalassospira povalilytica]|uniref:MFS transporter n=1 Tax=Thalassospira povalilytica TaxID=732237 RepID=UPI001D18B511|nr:MFS transporter [Thalassospira povalilytica]MCC4242086.1 hypothetical protein [Thalassospira povalilytica]
MRIFFQNKSSKMWRFSVSIFFVGAGKNSLLLAVIWYFLSDFSNPSMIPALLTSIPIIEILLSRKIGRIIDSIDSGLAVLISDIVRLILSSMMCFAIIFSFNIYLIYTIFGVYALFDRIHIIAAPAYLMQFSDKKDFRTLNSIYTGTLQAGNVLGTLTTGAILMLGTSWQSILPSACFFTCSAISMSFVLSKENIFRKKEKKVRKMPNPPAVPGFRNNLLIQCSLISVPVVLNSTLAPLIWEHNKASSLDFALSDLSFALGISLISIGFFRPLGKCSFQTSILTFAIASGATFTAAAQAGSSLLIMIAIFILGMLWGAGRISVDANLHQIFCGGGYGYAKGVVQTSTAFTTLILNILLTFALSFAKAPVVVEIYSVLYVAISFLIFSIDLRREKTILE